MDLQRVIFLWMAIGLVVGFVGGKWIGTQRHAGHLPYMPIGMLGAALFGFIVRAPFGADVQHVGDWLSLAAAIVGAAGSVVALKLVRVPQTIKH